MPRRGLVQHRESHPDLKYNDILIAKTISIIMRGGKKCTAENVFYGALDIVKEKSSADQVKIFKAAIDNIKPLVEVKSRRVGGASYQVPVDIRPVRRNALAIRWLVSFEIIDAANGTGSAIKKKEDTHRMAEANKAFAHYRW